MAGGVIIDGRARFEFGGSIAELKNTVHRLGKGLGKAGLKIGTWPMPERTRTGVEIRFAGSTAEFGKVIDGVEKLRKSVAIDTVPLPEKPVPPSRRGALQWRVAVRRRIKKKQPKT